VLGRLLKEQEQPRVLDLGPLCGDTLTYLASRGARVSVDQFAVPAPLPKRTPGAAPLEVPPFSIGQPDGMFDLVLAWEHIDFTPPDRLAEVGAELGRLLAPGGWVLLFCRDSRSSATGPASRFRVVADDRVSVEPLSGDPPQRYIHPNRDIERAFASFRIQGIHLQRSGVREILALKP
jgi:hypothetical protein